MLAAMFGVRLVADFRPWTRHAPGASLSETLDALAQADPGDDVLTVVALTSSLSLVSATFEQLGVASLGGRHIALRGYADLEERKVFEATFTELRAEERDVLYQARRRHKNTAIGIDDTGKPVMGGHVIDLGTLDELLRMTSKDDPETELVVHASKKAPRSAVVDVIDHAKAAGLQHFALAGP